MRTKDSNVTPLFLKTTVVWVILEEIMYVFNIGKKIFFNFHYFSVFNTKFSITVSSPLIIQAVVTLENAGQNGV